MSPSTPENHLHLHHKLTTTASSSFPDFIFTAFSLFILFSSSKPTINLLHKFPPPISCPLNSRRFLKITTMSISTRKNPSPNPPHHFANPQSLSDWLKPRLPSDSFAAWGVHPGTKNIHNLWLELAEGESSLLDSSPPVRTVEVVVVRVIGKDNRVLVEFQQELSDGSVRNRWQPLSEKMKPNESVEDAVVRAVKEELGSIIPVFCNFEENCSIVKILPDSYWKKVEERVSVSYPGLPARYVLHTVDALVDGLPEGEFCTEEGEEYEESDEKKAAHRAVYCKKHHWKWVDSDMVSY